MKRRMIAGGLALILSSTLLITGWIAFAQTPTHPRGEYAIIPWIPGPASLAFPYSGAYTKKGQLMDGLPARQIAAPAADGRVMASDFDPFALFEPYIVYGDAAAAMAVGIADLNDDSRNDVAVSSAFENLLYVYEQTISGTLSVPATYATGIQPDVLAVGDLNHDGRDDVVVANFGEDTIGVFLQDGTGRLNDQVAYSTARAPNAIAVGDLDADGLDDVVVSHWNESVIGIFYQQADGTLSTMQSVSSPMAGWDDIGVGDLNSDGLTDVVKMNGQYADNPSLSVYLQNASGNLDPSTPYDLEGVVGNGLALGDVTGDGLDDAILSHGANRPFSEIIVISQTITGTLGITTTYTASDIPETVELGDVNLDGRSDVVVAHGGWGTLSVYLQSQSGVLEPFDLYGLPVPGAERFGPQAVAVGDINSDGQPDIAVADSVHGLVLLYHSPGLGHLYFPFGATDFKETDTPIFDDFSDSGSGWPIIRSHFANFEYFNGEYRLANNVRYTAALVTARHNVRDLDLSVTGRQIGGVSGAYGLGFGFLNSPPVPQYYAFTVWPDFQEWNLIHFDGRFSVVLWGTSSAINTAGGPNRLRVVRQGDQLSLRANGVEVLAGTFPTYTGARFTGLVHAPMNVGHDVRFDDYELRTPQ